MPSSAPWSKPRPITAATRSASKTASTACSNQIAGGGCAAGRHRHPSNRRHDPRHDEPRQSRSRSTVETSGGTHDYSDRCMRCSTTCRSTRWSSSAVTVRSPSRTSSRSAASPSSASPRPSTTTSSRPRTRSGSTRAVAFATDAIDRLQTHAEAHHRIMVVEVMGRNTGWIALYAGVAGGADVILIPEIPYDLAQGRAARDKIARRWGRDSASRSSPKVRSRSAADVTGEAARDRNHGGTAGRHRRTRRERARGDDRTKRRARSCSVTCSAAARLPASIACWRRASARGRSSSRSPVSSARWSPSIRPHIVSVPIASVVGRTKFVPTDFDAVRTARATGISFGD